MPDGGGYSWTRLLGPLSSMVFVHAKREIQMPDSFHRTTPPSLPGPSPAARHHADVERARAALLENKGDWPAGRAMKTITRAELLAAGHVRMTPLQAVRARCRDCCAGSAHEVRLCTAAACPLWPFRMGRNPWRAEPSPEQRERGRALGATRRARTADQRQTRGPDDEAGRGPVPE